MDVLYFLRERLTFIRTLYHISSAPFQDTILAIEQDRPPFDDPPYSEDGEPPYLAEWMEAQAALEVLGRTCISLLSASLQLYFKAWEKELRVEWEKGEREKAFKAGMISGYRTCFEAVLGASWDESSVDLELLEQIVLARNRDQHPDDLTSMRVAHSMKDRSRFPQPFFARPEELSLFSGSDKPPSWISLSVHVSPEQLTAALDEVEKFAVWLDKQIEDWRYRSRRPERS